MKTIFTILLVLLFCFSINAQDGKFEFQNICGDPTVESISFTQFSGKVVEIVDGDTVVIKSKGKRRIVNLVTVDASSNNSEAQKFLSKKILKKNIFFSISYNSKKDDTQVFADIFYEDISVNRSMLTTGIARYKEPENYTFSNYKACVYQQLEEIAKKEKIGIWAK